MHSKEFHYLIHFSSDALKNMFLLVTQIAQQFFHRALVGKNGAEDKKNKQKFTAMRSHYFSSYLRAAWRRCLLPVRKRSLPFLTVDAIIGNQAFSVADVTVCSGLCYNNFSNRPRKGDV